MMASIYDFRDYRDFLNTALETTGPLRGIRSKLAVSLGCGTAFISQVMQGKVHFSLEHGLQTCNFLNLDEDETHYFLLLLQMARAGSKKLSDYYLKQIEVLQKKREKVSERVGSFEALTDVDQVRYYSSWHYSAIHVSLSVPWLKTKQDIGEALGIPISKVSEVLEFLEHSGIVSRLDGKWIQGTKRLHLPKESLIIGQHHSNWRVRALQAIQVRDDQNLHFSGAWSFSKKDAEKIRNLLLEAIEKSEPILRTSPEEVTFGIGIDFYRLFG